MISAPLRVSAPKGAVGGSSFLLGASSSKPESKSKPKPSRIRCAAAAAAAAGTERGVAGAGADTLYEVLGLRAGATGREIKAAYRRLARELHPDVAPAAPGAAADFVRLHDAYATLSDPDSRARYDRRAALVPAVAVAQRTGSRGGSGVYGQPRRRTWETDQCW